ncbi:unnamed protein product [Acanthoscelides obtectus]|uniref:HTH CENPB-type domain-containing protein n=1 Tax=Acanthoscelides obtectus TaxID=200917 RepID=A0A9P0Q5M2_ACAOB|nr:unnamed protein product [Acanthoscelides obtectus]CAK1672123.1 Tigger transposable element-derived protein 1 [Acanthoscelides obtectus]
MVLTIKAVRTHVMGYKTAAKHFQVPKGTLERYVKIINFSPEELVRTTLGRKPALGKAIEDELVRYCLDMDNRFFGLRRSDVKRMAFELAIANNIQHPFSQEKGVAGKKWLRGFFKRNPQLSVRSPQGMSNARIRGFNQESVASFFDWYEKELSKINFAPQRLFNVDETGISVVQHKRSKVISAKGKKQVATLTSAERGGLITVVTCMNAVGTYVPPLIVWPRKNMKIELMDGAPTGSIYACHPSGWIQAEIFTQWFDHFIKFTKPTPSDPVLLVLDGHYSHTRNIDVINKARENHVSIVCLPPHSTHRMQPLDVGFTGPLKTYYAQEIETWLRNNPDRIVTPFIIARLFSVAYNRAATMEVSVNSFRTTGLFPLNRNIFRNHDFSVFEVEEKLTVPEDTVSRPPPGSSTESRNIEYTSGKSEGISCIKTALDNPRPGTSKDSSDIEDAADDPRPGNSKESNDQGAVNSSRKAVKYLSEPTKLVSPVQIKPLPKIKSKKPSARAGSAALITSSPYKDDLIESLDKKLTKKVKFDDAREAKFRKPKSTKRFKKKRADLSDSSTDESDDLGEVVVDDESDGDENYDAECLFCTSMYSADKHGEQWVRCTVCYRWAMKIVVQKILSLCANV